MWQDLASFSTNYRTKHFSLTGKHYRIHVLYLHVIGWISGSYVQTANIGYQSLPLSDRNCKHTNLYDSDANMKLRLKLKRLNPMVC